MKILLPKHRRRRGAKIWARSPLMRGSYRIEKDSMIESLSFEFLEHSGKASGSFAHPLVFFQLKRSKRLE